MAIALPKISIKSQINAQQAPEFLGRITLDELRPGKFEGTPYQWVLAVMPYKFPVKGSGFQNYINIKDKNLQGDIADNSQLGMHLAAFQRVFPDVDFNLGEGDLIDLVGVFRREEYSYPPNKDGNVFKTQLLIPTREATAEELEEYGIEALKSGPTEFDEAQREAILKALVGKKKSSFQKAAFAARLSADLVSAIVSGEAVDYLIESEYAEFNSDDELVRV